MLKEEKECCPVFDSEKWDKKIFNWNKKPFLIETIPTFFHIPYPPLIGKKIVKMFNAAEEAGVNIKDKNEILVLFRDSSPFKTEIYYSIADEIEGCCNSAISGKFVTLVFDGPYNRIPKYIKEMDKYLSESNSKAKDYYVHYAYCPGCAQKYGHNYIILFAEM